MNINNMREQIVAKKALQQQQNLIAQDAIAKMEKLITEFPEDTITDLESYGFDVRDLFSVNTEKLLNDKEYLNGFRTKLESMANTLSKEITSLCSE